MTTNCDCMYVIYIYIYIYTTYSANKYGSFCACVERLPEVKRNLGSVSDPERVATGLYLDGYTPRFRHGDRFPRSGF